MSEINEDDILAYTIFFFGKISKLTTENSNE